MKVLRSLFRSGTLAWCATTVAYQYPLHQIHSGLIKPIRELHLAFQYLLECQVLRRAPERRPSGDKLEEDAAERPDIGSKPCINQPDEIDTLTRVLCDARHASRVVSEYLGRDILRRSHKRALLPVPYRSHLIISLAPARQLLKTLTFWRLDWL